MTPADAPAAPQVRTAHADDLDAVCDLVNHYIETTSINFRTAPQRPEEWRADLAALGERYPWLVAELDGEVAGIAYAGPWKPREAYALSAETTVYVRHGLHGRGVGRALYGSLLAELDARGFRAQVGAVALPNEPSVALHEAMGFRHVGTLREVGFKQGRWWDVGYWQRLSPRRPLTVP